MLFVFIQQCYVRVSAAEVSMQNSQCRCIQRYICLLSAQKRNLNLGIRLLHGKICYRSKKHSTIYVVLVYLETYKSLTIPISVCQYQPKASSFSNGISIHLEDKKTKRVILLLTTKDTTLYKILQLFKETLIDINRCTDYMKNQEY